MCLYLLWLMFFYLSYNIFNLTIERKKQKIKSMCMVCIINWWALCWTWNNKNKLLPGMGIEHGPHQWEHQILTTRLTEIQKMCPHLDFINQSFYNNQWIDIITNKSIITHAKCRVIDRSKSAKCTRLMTVTFCRLHSLFKCIYSADTAVYIAVMLSLCIRHCRLHSHFLNIIAM